MKGNVNRRLVKLSEIKDKPVEWLWQDRIPLGALTILDGDPGQSKSTLTYDLAARVTSGQPMPLSDQLRPPAGVVLVQAEDSQAGVVKPAITAMGGDPAKVLVYERSKFGDQPLTLPADVPVLEEAVKAVTARLVVVDPLSAFLAGQTTSDVKVRQMLGPLAELAARRNLAVVVVRHLTKGGSGIPLYRGVGSIGIIGLARSALWVTGDPGASDPHAHLLVPTKSNLAAATTLRYRTVKPGPATLIEWLGTSHVRADDLTGVGRGELPRLQQAMVVLYTWLADSPVSVGMIKHLAGEAGVSFRTLERAKQGMHVVAYKTGGGIGSRWYWRLPDDPSLLDGVKALAAQQDAAKPASTAVAD